MRTPNQRCCLGWPASCLPLGPLSKRASPNDAGRPSQREPRLNGSLALEQRPPAGKKKEATGPVSRARPAPKSKGKVPTKPRVKSENTPNPEHQLCTVKVDPATGKKRVTGKRQKVTRLYLGDLFWCCLQFYCVWLFCSGCRTNLASAL